MWLLATVAIVFLLVNSRCFNCAGLEDKFVRSQLEEHCQKETFKGRCRWNSEVIVMTSARWGRMRTGRCLNIHPNLMALNGQDPLFLGCSEDVLSITDSYCSGLSSCDLRITESRLDDIQPCYPDLTRYLLSSYTCVKVVPESRSCGVPVTNDHQFISSMSTSSSDVTTMTSSCGSKSHPWRLEAPAGQRINISLLDFAASGTDRNGLSRDHDVSCQQYGCVVEKSNKKNVSLCAEGGAGLRESAVYTSDTNSVEIVLVIPQNDRTNASKYNFLIRVEAVGCTNVVPPDNAWLKRSNNDIIIGCYSSQQTWKLKCDGRDWTGQIGACPELYIGAVSSSSPTVDLTDTSITVLVIMIVIAGTAAVICLTIIVIGCLCLKRYNSSEIKKLPAPSMPNFAAANNMQTNARCSTNYDGNSLTRAPISAGTQSHRQQQGRFDERQPLEAGGTVPVVQYFLLDNQQTT